MDKHLTPLQDKLLQMLKWFHNFCVQNHLQYYVLGGTMLGAVRHQGFIPWDDDVDIGLPRKDYKRLQELLRNQTGRYVFEFPGLHEDYPYPTSKLYDTSTTLIENTRNHIKRGIFLDIFPLDGLGNCAADARHNYKPIVRRLNLLLARSTGIRPGRRWYKNLAVVGARFIPDFLLSNKKLLGALETLCQQHDFDTSAYGGNLLGAWRFKELMPRSIFGCPTLYRFEDMQVYGAQDYEKYLTHLYGNWRQLPPKEKQVSHHDFVELNLDQPYLPTGQARANPLISVIIPVYNVEQYLSKCVDSVLAQTYQNLEIILVDDGSTDNSGSICNEYAAKNTRVRVIRENNGGLSVARNTGIKLAKGEYLAFIDSDDWVAPTFIEMLWKLAVAYQAPISVVGRYAVLSKRMCKCYNLPKGRKEEVIGPQKGSFDKRQILQIIYAAYGRFATGKLFKSSLFNELLFPPGLYYEDIWTLYRLLPRIDKIAVSNAFLYYYNRQNENSISRGKFNTHMLDYFTVTDDFVKAARQIKDTQLLRVIQRERLAHILGFFKRMMLADFQNSEVIAPMQTELRRNLWILLLKPRPFMATAFGVVCVVNFQLAKKILRTIYRA